MFYLFEPLKGLKTPNRVVIDNFVFVLHYKATALLLLVCSIMVSCYQYLGCPISCIVDGIPNNVMDTYCWTSSNFSIPNRFTGTAGKDVIHPGVGSYVEGEDEARYHKYYQWVCLVLFFQAIGFYFPHYLWKTWEGGSMKMLVGDFYIPFINYEENYKPHQKRLIEDYFTNHLHSRNVYALKFFFCEFLNFINVIMQIYFTDVFLGGTFSTYGYDVLWFTEMEQEERGDPMSRVFPKVTKCTFNIYGPSGTIEKLDGLCLLPLNNVNEKIYVFLWVWFTLLAAVSGVSLVFHAATLVVPRAHPILLRAHARLATQDQIDTIAENFNFGDFFVLMQLSKNVDIVFFEDLISNLAEELDR